MRFTISKLLFATAIVGLFLGLRSGYVLNYDIEDGTTDSQRIGWANMVTVAVVSVYAAAQHGFDARPHPLIFHTAIAGAATAALCTAIWELEVSWYAVSHWRADAIHFGLFVFRHAIGGGVLGTIVGFIWGVATQDTKN